MPVAAPKPCARAGCGKLVEAGERHCPGHRAEHRRDQDADRGSAASRGYGRSWQAYRLTYLAAHPLCVRCEPAVVVSTVVDHIVPHRGDRALFWDPDNHQSLCKPCHDRKTAVEDTGFASGYRRPTP